MKTYVLVDAAPGFEAAVEAALRKVRGVTAVARFKERNYDIVASVEAGDAALLERILTNEMRMITGIAAVERMDSPPPRITSLLGK